MAGVGETLCVHGIWRLSVSERVEVQFEVVMRVQDWQDYDIKVVGWQPYRYVPQELLYF